MSDRIRVTEATLPQAPLVHQIMLESYAEYIGRLNPPSSAMKETVEDVVKAMESGGAVLAWQEHDGDAAAVGSARYALHDDYFYVGRVGVLPAYRGQGIASAMLEALEGIARRLGYDRICLGVRLALPGNIAMYEHMGYRISTDHPPTLPTDLVVWMEKRL